MRSLTLFFLMAVSVLPLTLKAETPAGLSIGDRASNTEQVLLDVGGEEMTLQQVLGENGLLVIFTCNTCPYVLAWQDRYPEIAEYCDKNGIGLIMVNSNEARRHTVDSYDAMKEHARKNEYKFLYAVDANHELADAFGATKTPDVFLFNSELSLVYKGAIDDNHQDAAEVRSPFLMTAMEHMLKGKAIDPAVTRAIGCTIKRVE